MKILLIISAVFLMCACAETLHAEDIVTDTLSVYQDATIAGAAGFGTIYAGMLDAPTSSTQAFRFSVAQSSQEVPVEVTHSSWIEGYYHDVTTTTEQYGTVPGGHYEAQYGPVIISTEWIPPVYDASGEELEAGRYQDVWGTVWLSEYWVDESYWGVTGSYTETTTQWVDGYTNTWTEAGTGLEYGAPRLETTATRSDANWVWRVPGATSTEYKDVLTVWHGGLRIPSPDPDRFMVLAEDGLTQSLTQPNTSSPSAAYTKVTAEEIKANKVIGDINGTGEENTSQLQPQYLRLTQRVANQGTSTTTQTQISAEAAHFGGGVSVAGSLTVRGVIRAMPGGDLGSGSFTHGVQP